LPVVLGHATYRDIRSGQYDTAVLPWGATEAHNLHLPYGTDIIQADRIAVEASRLAASRGAKVVVLPVIPYGVNTGQMDIPLTINMNPSTQMALLEDIASSLDHASVPRLVILNSHGGNDFRQMIRELQPRHNVFLCTVNWYRSLDLKAYFDEPGDHADEMETSLMLYIAPDHVLPPSEWGDGATKLPRVRAFREGWAWAPRRWTQVTQDTGAGNPRKATAEKGKKYFEAVTGTIADFLVELGNVDPNDLYA
jgi:creatinine amidohydrolase